MKFFIGAVVGAIIGFYAAQKVDVVVIYKQDGYATPDVDGYDFGHDGGDYNYPAAKPPG